jgi:hypothetical protein
MSSKDKFYGIQAAAHGFDDIGSSQPSGSISGATLATKWGPRYAGKTQLVISATGGAFSSSRTSRSPIHIISSDVWLNGPSSILKVLGPTQVIVNKSFQTGSGGTGQFTLMGGEGAWDAFMPIGGTVSGSNLPTLTFWSPSRQAMDENNVDYEQGRIYPFPAGIKTILITSTGNLRLFRSATLRPDGQAAQ